MSAPSDSVRDWKPRHVRRADIVNAAVKLWAKKGYHGTGITDLCEATGMGKGALYHHFDSKEAILVEIYNRVSERMLPLAREVDASDMAPAAAIRTLSSEWMTSIYKRSDHYAVFFRETEALTGEAAKTIQRNRHEFQTIVTRTIARGIERGDFIDTSPELAAMSFVGMHAWSAFWLSSGASNPYRWWRSAGERPTADEISDAFCTYFLAGLER